ncbi:hypothetical protein EUTSA_v10006438mg [Eutrema salsugineum]|uniref:Prolamin-like domain-containing protein n=1 Tax=Eutrema salsugineum TaxID=72664 RepID=V4LWZ2_EUTSA|nr:uncharacterized protein LOC18019944 [Eutrema salsugineum]ESQ44423.1 hypothetical protein EUTSA_v10006438mg [Eutrema salsugineum]
MAFKPSMVTKSMAAALFTIIAMAALASAATGLAQSPEPDRIVNQCMARISSKCAVYATAEMYRHGQLKENGCCLEIYHMGQSCLNIVTKHLIETLVPKLQGVEKQDFIEKSTQVWYLCVPV